MRRGKFVQLRQHEKNIRIVTEERDKFVKKMRLETIDQFKRMVIRTIGPIEAKKIQVRYIDGKDDFRGWWLLYVCGCNVDSGFSNECRIWVGNKRSGSAFALDYDKETEKFTNNIDKYLEIPTQSYRRAIYKKLCKKRGDAVVNILNKINFYDVDLFFDDRITRMYLHSPLYNVKKCVWLILGKWRESMLCVLNKDVVTYICKLLIEEIRAHFLNIDDQILQK